MTMEQNMYAPMPTNGEADVIVIKPNGDIYNCYLMPGYDNATNANIEHLPLWRIEKIEKHMSDDTTTFKRLYPNGSTSFAFIADEHEQYNYTFKK